MPHSPYLDLAVVVSAHSKTASLFLFRKKSEGRAFYSSLFTYYFPSSAQAAADVE